MHLAYPWFPVPALLVACLGLQAVRHLRTEGAPRSEARWVILVTLSPMIFWAVAQIAARFGGLP